ncbi:amylo-alpha-1,6-glucosidase [Rhodoplanes sp.]|uniref:amylo-alpha-1,6-glucosidase n=1 Tax=Rhodoplanes sp. TaxID=1968906 RepID=UPI0025CF48A9|nr:amylo-alpha-1,6-glucosidase [Rhodoplanes sp.]
MDHHRVPAESAAETPFYIATRSVAERPRRILKHGDTFAVFDSFGDIGAAPTGQDGLFNCDTRHLSRFEFALNGHQPLLLGSNVRDDNAVLTVDLTNPDIYFDDRLVLPKDTVHVIRTIFLWDSTAHQRLSARNFGDQTIELNLSFAFASDFADLFEVRGMRRERRGECSSAVNGTDGVDLTYRGLDHKLRQTRLVFDPPPTTLGKHIAAYAVRLAPGGQVSIFSAATCHEEKEPPLPFLKAMRANLRDRREQAAGATSVTTSNHIFNEILCQSAADLAMLVTQTAEGRYPYAGIPWYSTTFGRDGLVTAMELLWCDPSIAKGVLQRLAAFQAQTLDLESDAEPGKILHEMRSGEMALLGEVPFRLYYGSVDATPLFVMLACLYAERTGDLDTLRNLWPHVEAALAWIDGPADKDGDGFIEYDRATDQGLANQGWKDSYDAVFHADGRLAEGPIALCEVQGYVYAAKQLAARAAQALGRRERALTLAAEAVQLAEAFDRAFWRPDIGTYALALDGDKSQCGVRSSNAGHALFTGIARPERAHAVARGFMDRRFFSGWGIRTVATEAARFNPMSYHNGSVWPHDNALIALGLARYDLKSEVERVFQGLFDAATAMDLRRLPELFCGFKRRAGRGPTLYPVACSPQAWAAATPFSLLQASLGLAFDPDKRTIKLHNPRLPSFLSEVTIRDLQLAGSRVDLALYRHGDEVALRVLRNVGEVQVSVVYGQTLSSGPEGASSRPAAPRGAIDA